MIEVYPTYDDYAYRIELWGDDVRIWRRSIRCSAGQPADVRITACPIYPRRHYVMSQETRVEAMQSIRNELEWWHKELEKQGKHIEAQRFWQRTLFDLEMMKEIGYCHGIENYSRHFSGAAARRSAAHAAGLSAHDAILFLDESHQTFRNCTACITATARARNAGGARLPHAERADNRPLTV